MPSLRLPHAPRRFLHALYAQVRNPALALGLALAITLPLGACRDRSGEGPLQPLAFSAIPDANQSDLTQKYDKIADYLSAELGVPVEYKPASSYGASVEAFKAGDVQLAWFGGVTGVQARWAVPGARAIAQGRVDPRFYSYFIANRSTGIERTEEFPLALEGHTFTFGSEGSTSGRVMPEYFVRRFTGKTPEEFFGHPNRFSGAHDLTALQVQDGTVDAGALSYKKYDSMVAAGEIDPEVCRVIWVTPRYPDYNWTAHPLLEERYGKGFTDRLQAALVGIEDPELLNALLRPEGLIPASNEDFAPLEETMRNIGFARN